MNEENKKALIHRLNRAEGQLKVLKETIVLEKGDCREVLQQIKTVTNALKRFGEAYVKEKAKTCLNEGKSQKEMGVEFISMLGDVFNL